MKDYTQYDTYKNSPSDNTMWVDTVDTIGEHVFTFDGKKFYNLFSDYPHNMSASEVEIFSRENPYWREFFADRFI